MGFGRIFPGGTITGFFQNFCRAKSGEIWFYELEIKKATCFAEILLLLVALNVFQTNSELLSGLILMPEFCPNPKSQAQTRPKPDIYF